MKKHFSFSIFLMTLVLMSCNNDSPPPSCSLTSKHDTKVNSVVKLWPGGIIPYQFDSSFPNDKEYLVTGAMDTWESLTHAINFRPKTSNDTDYVTIKWVTKNSCNSSLGSKLGKSTMNFSDFCRVNASYFHEVGHLIGMTHEHQRIDRYGSLSYNDDALVTLFTEGGISQGVINSITEQVYEKEDISYSNNSIYPNAATDVPFDKNSIMMYGSKLSNPKSITHKYLTENNIDLFTDKSCNSISAPNFISTYDIKKVQVLYPKVFIIKNNSNISFNNIRVRLEDSYDFTQSINPGGTFILHYNPDNGYYYYKDNNGEYKVQQLDFNNGRTSDDMDFSYNASNSVTYKSNKGTKTTIVSNLNATPNNISFHDAVDTDGVDGSTGVRFRMSVGEFNSGGVKSPLAIICNLENLN